MSLSSFVWFVLGVAYALFWFHPSNSQKLERGWKIVTRDTTCSGGNGNRADEVGERPSNQQTVSAAESISDGNGEGPNSSGGNSVGARQSVSDGNGRVCEHCKECDVLCEVSSGQSTTSGGGRANYKSPCDYVSADVQVSLQSRANRGDSFSDREYTCLAYQNIRFVDYNDKADIAGMLENSHSAATFSDSLSIRNPSPPPVRKRNIQPRFPILEPIPVVVDIKKELGGGCVLGNQICDSMNPDAIVDLKNGIDNRFFPYDPHVRDYVASILTPCLHKSNSCFMVDIGSNFGLHSLTGLFFNTHVTSVEPQPDLCISLANSAKKIIELYGTTPAVRGSSSDVRCGYLSTWDNVVAKKRWFTRQVFSHYRYDGKVTAEWSTKKYKLPDGLPNVHLRDVLGLKGPLLAPSKESPIRTLAEKPSPKKVVHLMKIDTDSIDCIILEKEIFPMIENGDVEILNLSFESNGCPEIFNILYNFQTVFGYTVFRADVFSPRFKEDGSLPQHIGNITLYDSGTLYHPYVEDTYELRFMRHLWRFKSGLLKEEWRKAVGPGWQFFVTKEKWEGRFLGR